MRPWSGIILILAGLLFGGAGTVAAAPAVPDSTAVSGDETENDGLYYMNTLDDSRGTALLEPQNFHGPRVLVIGPPTEDALEYAAGMIVRYAKRFDAENAEVKVVTAEGEQIILAKPNADAEQAETVAT